MKFCKNCNITYDQEAKFCTDCGRTLVKKRYCEHCGSEIDIEAIYCKNCGKAQRDTEIEKDIINKKEKNKKRNKNKILFPLLLIGLIVVIFYFKDNATRDKILETNTSNFEIDDRNQENLNLSLDELEKKGYVLVDNDDFEWISIEEYIKEFGYEDVKYYLEKGFYEVNNEYSKGTYKYTGKEDYVIIPEKIKGDKVVNCSFMFRDSEVKGVATINSNIENMSGMFFGSEIKELDLSNFDTSNVVDISHMFVNSEAEILDLSNFDTSNVENMNGMFWWSKIKELDLLNFDTSNVENMAYMFYGSDIRELDLSSFNFKNKNIDFIFYGSNISKIYVKNKEDRDLLYKAEGTESPYTNINILVK